MLVSGVDMLDYSDCSFTWTRRQFTYKLGMVQISFLLIDQI